MSETVRVRVLYDYEYSTKTGRQISLKKGHLYCLLKKTNTEWWLVGQARDDKEPFFVPANYIEIIQNDVPPEVKVTKKVPPPKPPKPKLPQPALDPTAVISQLDQMLDTVVLVESDAEQDASSPTTLKLDTNDNLAELSKAKADAIIPDKSPQTVPTEVAFPPGSPKYPPSADRETPTKALVSGPDENSFDAAKTRSLDRKTQLERVPDANNAGLDHTVVVNVVNARQSDAERPKIQPRQTDTNYNDDMPTYANLDELAATVKPKDQTTPKEEEEPLYANTSNMNKQASGSSETASGPPSPGQAPPGPPQPGQAPLRYLDSEWCVYFHGPIGKQFYYNTKSGQSTWTEPEIKTQPGASPTVTVQRHSSNVSQTSTTSSNVFETEADSQLSATIPATNTNSLKRGGQHTRIREMQTMLNKTKITENGKKVKKNWALSLVVTTGPYMYFYKDQKSMQPKPNLPVGKFESQHELRGAKVEMASKDLSSKKNVILLTLVSGVQFLLQSDDKHRMEDFYTTIDKNISMLDGTESSNIPSMLVRTSLLPEPPQEAAGNKKKRLTRREKTSTADKPPALDDNPNDPEKNTKIKDWLLYWLLRRPGADTLKERGIIKDGIFGSHLQSICDREKTDVPQFVQYCIQTVHNRGLLVDGIYRISGNMAAIQKIRFKVDQSEAFDLMSPEWDIHDVSGALKLFFRELQEPLFPFSLYDKFTKASQILNGPLKLRAFQDVMKEVPKVNLCTMKELFLHLKNVVSHSASNRMEAQNIAIVFGPTLMRPFVETGNMAINLVMQGQIVEFMLLQYSNLF